MKLASCVNDHVQLSAGDFCQMTSELKQQRWYKEKGRMEHSLSCNVLSSGLKEASPATWLQIRVDSVKFNFQDRHCLWIFICVLWAIIIDERLDSEILSVFSPECYKFFCKKECICTRVCHTLYKTLNGDVLQPCPSSCFKLGRVSNFSTPLFYVPTRWFLWFLTSIKASQALSPPRTPCFTEI